MSRALMWLVRVYQRSLSYLVPVRCRFHPSCSEYTLQALQQHGAVRGVWLGLRRILRCQPLGRPGYDPVPVTTDSRQINRRTD